MNNPPLNNKNETVYNHEIWNSGFSHGRRAELYPLLAIGAIEEAYVIRRLTAQRDEIMLEYKQFCISHASGGACIDPTGYRAVDAYLAHLDLGRPLTVDELNVFRFDEATMS